MSSSVSVRALKKVFSSSSACRKVLGVIESLCKRLEAKGITRVKIMSFCGTHEWVVTHYGIRSVVPKIVELVAGPGCPVCVTPSYVIKYAIDLSLRGVRVFTFGDMARVPIGIGSSRETLLGARARGGNVELVYSFADAVERARDGRESVFLAIGFETTAPSYSIPLERGAVPKNLSLLSVVRLTPPVMRYALEVHRGISKPVDGVIAPGHVSTVIGSDAWRFLPEEFGVATVVAGFEPLDVLIAIAKILEMVLEGVPQLLNEYRRSVKPEGNRLAKESMRRVFREVDALWRGIGIVPRSGYDLREEYSEWDAYERYSLEKLPRDAEAHDHPPGCLCSKIILGLAKPTDCPHFGKSCSPSHPLGPCMVSLEGTCRIWAQGAVSP
ncbi:MAG: hydrogenase formation protein HypD [Crenarchaeota archaeon]|nr:hydrogenase formation protein HypD [Thermoproteota archaeon]